MTLHSRGMKEYCGANMTQQSEIMNIQKHDVYLTKHNRQGARELHSTNSPHPPKNQHHPNYLGKSTSITDRMFLKRLLTARAQKWYEICPATLNCHMCPDLLATSSCMTEQANNFQRCPKKGTLFQ